MYTQMNTYKHENTYVLTHTYYTGLQKTKLYKLPAWKFIYWVH